MTSVCAVSPVCADEGRCPPPTQFDSNYCYSLGLTAGALIGLRVTGVMACLQNLVQPTSQWQPKGIPLTAMLAMERRKGKDKPVIRKALVELDGAPFKAFVERRGAWRLRASFPSPGPVQFEGPCAELVSVTLRLEQGVHTPEEIVAPLAAQRMREPPELPEVLTSGSKLRVVHGSVPTTRAHTAPALCHCMLHSTERVHPLCMVCGRCQRRRQGRLECAASCWHRRGRDSPRRCRGGAGHVAA